MKNVDDIVKSLTLEEKVKLLCGKGNWFTYDCNGKVPSIMMTDGPHGLRKMTSDVALEVNNSVPATCFPTASAVAAGWDPDLSRLMGQTIAREAKKEQISIVLGCGINMKRSPLCGRNFEYFSEDPYLAGKIGIGYVQGMQGEGVGTSVKHFAANNQETRRQSSNSQIDERALQEIYLRAFEMIVKEAQPTTLMASYNRINGRYGCANSHHLKELLRDKWGFKGAVISDWGATMDAVDCHKNGLTLEMPSSGGYHDKKILSALKSGEYTEAELDENVREVLEKLSSLSDKLVDNYEVDYGSHHDIARQIEDNCAVLLKNEGALPIAKDKRLIVIGEMAEHMRFQGGGSSHIIVTKNVSALDALKTAGYDVTYLQGYNTEKSSVNEELHIEAVEYIKKNVDADNAVVLFCMGLNDATESEGFDRKNLLIPANQTALLKDIANNTSVPVVAVTFGGAPMDYSWEDKVDSILHMYLGGQAVGEAVADLISGEAAPSGRLAETVPYSIEDTPAYRYFALNQDDVEYRESIFIGYRYYSTFKVPVRYPFGYGLTYTKFEYSDINIERDTFASGSIKVSCKIKNVGDRDGSEVVQLYVMPPKDNIIRAAKELKGFSKIKLAAGQEAVVEFTLDERSFAIYCDDSKEFEMISGIYGIGIGASVEDIRLNTEVNIEGREYYRNERELFPGYFAENSHGMEISEEEFERLLGRPLSNLRGRGRGEYDLTCTFGDVSRASLFGRLVRKIVKSKMESMLVGVDEDDPVRKMTFMCIEEGALESLLSITGGEVSPKLVDILILFANKKYFKAIGRAFKR